MTYQELLNNIRDLGFSDDEELQDFGDLVPEAIDRAITEIGLNVAPQIERYEFSIDDTDTGMLYITMTDVDDLFLSFADTPVLFEKDGEEIYRKFSDYEIETEDTIVIDSENCKGSFRIFYKVDHERFTGTEAQLREDLPLPRRAHHLVPLLASYYVWLDDDVQKAIYYYNQYETFSNQLIADDEKPKGRFVGRGI